MPELIIVGGGPAGLTAAVYAVRRRLDVLLVAPELGGKTRFPPSFPGAEEHRVIRGGELVGRFLRELEYLQFAHRLAAVERITAAGPGAAGEGAAGSPAAPGSAGGFRVRLTGPAGGGAGATPAAVPAAAPGDAPGPVELEARAVILATGCETRRLGVPGEKELFQRGLYGSATSYAHLFLDKEVLVLGGGPRAHRAAAELAASGARVHRLEQGERLTALRGEPGAPEAVLAGPAGRTRTLRVDGVFNEEEPRPNSALVTGLAELDAEGYVRVDARCRTSCPGLFAAGDVTAVHREQILVAVGEGAKACLSALEFLEGA
jgi:thioredoxin reductase